MLALKIECTFFDRVGTKIQRKEKSGVWGIAGMTLVKTTAVAGLSPDWDL